MPLFRYIFSIAVLAFLIACSDNTQNTHSERDASNYPIVEAASIESNQDVLFISSHGLIQGKELLNLRAEVQGIVDYISPKLSAGRFLEQGEVILRLDQVSLKAELAQAQANLAGAKASRDTAKEQVDRLTELELLQASSERALDVAKLEYSSAQASFESAKAAVTLAQERLSDSELTSPFYAQVLSENITQGSLVTPTQQLAQLFKTDSAIAIVGLSAQQADLVKRAMDHTDSRSVSIFKDGENVNTTASIAQILPSVDAQARTVEFEISLPDAFVADAGAGLLLNDYIQVRFPISLPENIYSARTGVIRKNKYVWMIDQKSKLKKIPIEPLSRFDNLSFFLSKEDLSDKKLLLSGLVEEKEGMRVEIVNTVEATHSSLSSTDSGN